MNELEKNKQEGEHGLQGKELYEINKKQKEEASKKEAFKETLSKVPKKIGKYLFYVVIVVGIFGSIGWYIATRPPIIESDIISRETIHWHPELSIYIKGQIQEIPGNAGTASIMHTHDATGMIHVHPKNKLVLKDDITLGNFFKLWGKKFSSTCIFDNCNSSEGKVNMTVNGEENTEFENYVMRDKDKIEVRYE